MFSTFLENKKISSQEIPDRQEPYNNLFIHSFNHSDSRSYLRSMGEMSFQEAMQQFLKQSRLKHGIQAVQIEELWEKMMGKTIAKYTEKIQIIGHTLFITSSVAPLKNELLYQKDMIIQRVNEAMGEKIIKEVVIK